MASSAPKRQPGIRSHVPFSPPPVSERMHPTTRLERDDLMEDEMLLENKTAVIYAAGGTIGGAVARAFAREGARLFLTGRNAAKVDAVAKEIAAAGGAAETAQVDALDEKAVEEHLNAVLERAGGVDVS